MHHISLYNPLLGVSLRLPPSTPAEGHKASANAAGKSRDFGQARSKGYKGRAKLGSIMQVLLLDCWALWRVLGGSM